MTTVSVTELVNAGCAADIHVTDHHVLHAIRTGSLTVVSHRPIRIAPPIANRWLTAAREAQRDRRDP